VTDHLQLIRIKLDHLIRMREHLSYSLGEVQKVLLVNDWKFLKPEQHESLAAFRVRFGEFQEHLGKTMRAVAIEEEQDVERFGAVLAFMERLRVLDSTEHWKVIRELRNAVNRDYEDNTERLAEFFLQLTKETPVLFGYFRQIEEYCVSAYEF